jgi:hypothetical protein
MNEFTFANEDQAIEAWKYLDQIGRQRNKQTTVVFREKCKVYIKLEYASPYLCNILKDLSKSF